MLKSLKCHNCGTKIGYHSLFIKTERFECSNCKYRGKIFNIEKRSEINRTTISDDISDCERVFGAYVFAGECDSRIIVREWYKHRSIFNFYVLSIFLYLPVIGGTYFLAIQRNTPYEFFYIYNMEVLLFIFLFYVELTNRFNITKILITNSEIYIKRGPIPLFLKSIKVYHIDGFKDLEMKKFFTPLSPFNGFSLFYVDQNDKKHCLFNRVKNEKQINQIVSLFKERLR